MNTAGTGTGAPARSWAQRPSLLAVPAVLFVLVVFLGPFLGVLRVAGAGLPEPGSLSFFDTSVWQWSTLTSVAGGDFFRSVLLVTLGQGLLIATVCMLIAVPFAAYLHRARGWWKAALIVAVAMPKLVNLLVLLYGVTLLLGRTGFINGVLTGTGLLDDPLPLFANTFAVVFTEVLIVAPYPILILTAAFHSADPRHYDAARSLGAGPVRAYLETVIRPAYPALISAALISAVWGVGAFVGPLVLGNPRQYTVSVEVYDLALQQLRYVEAAGWAVLAVTAFGIAVALVRAVSRRRA